MGDRLQQLLDIYLLGELTEDQRLELVSLLRDERLGARLGDQILEQLSGGEYAISGDLPGTEERIVQGTLEQIRATSAIRPVHRFPRWGWAAAILILALGSGSYLWLTHRTVSAPLSVVKNDVAPGGNRATLTLSDGTVVPLDSAASGAIARQGNTSVVKLGGGRISYKGAPGDADGSLMNTLHTPRGGQYQLTLPDGTRVWLNAASSITYPVAFIGKDRPVQISGEAYLEVATNKGKPFIVNVEGGSAIEVLGTHFNVNSYSDENSVKTTLLEGSIKVTAGPNAAVTLKPGQQAQLTMQHLSVDNSADTEKVLAWKNGLFDFDGASLQEVLRQLSRWYDVDVVYEKGVPNIQFEGEISRNIQLSDLLKVLARAEVKFRIEEGHRLVVLP